MSNLAKPPKRRPKRKLSERQINLDLDKETIERLDDYCAKQGFKKKKIVELAILRFLNQREKRAGV